MKHKRLNRDGWGFQFYPYYQMRIDSEIFHRLVCLIRLTDGEKNFRETPKAGKVQVTGAGMTWLELIPDDTKRVITVMYFQNGTHGEERSDYPLTANTLYQPSVRYVDVTEEIVYDECGIAVFIDKYLDVIFTPEGDVLIDDRDELDEAYDSGELTELQYEEALSECGRIVDEYSKDIRKTDIWCAEIRKLAEKRIADAEAVKPCREILELNAETGK